MGQTVVNVGNQTLLIRSRAAEPVTEYAPPRGKMPERILVIEDEPAVRDSVAMVLEAAGFLVDQADHGATGMRLLQA